MSEIVLSKALCLPALDLEALLQGRTIAALSKSFRNPAHFLLCPVDIAIDDEQLALCYRPEFLRSLRLSSSFANPDAITIRAWAQGRSCRAYGTDDDLRALSRLTAWSFDYLQMLAQTRHKIFVMFLQVHRFPQPIKLMMSRLDEAQAGRYLSVPGTWSDQNTRSLLADKTFAYRQKQLVTLSPLSVNPKLEGLQTELVALRENSLGAMSLDRDLRYFLGWSRAEETQLYDSDLSWIRQITQVGRSTDNAEFVRLVQKSFTKIGFNFVDHVTNNLEQLNAHIHSAYRREYDETPQLNLAESFAQSSWTDIDYDQPYSLTGKCIAGKDVVVSYEEIEQLAYLPDVEVSYRHVSTTCKILLAAGPLTDQAQKTAKKHFINVMRPDTLQRLSELRAQHPGSVDLVKLGACLQAVPHGEEADGKINQFIQESLYGLKVRAALIEAVKVCMESTEQSQVGSDAICTAYAVMSEADLPDLSMAEIRDILIELSSPVVGLLGRVRGDDEQYSFYFLRELFVGNEQLMVSYD